MNMVPEPGDIEAGGHLIALSSDMLGTIGFDGRLKTLNASWQKHLGYEHHELVSTPLLDLIHVDDHIETAEALVRATNIKDAHAAIVNRCRCRDGSHKWISWRLKASAEKRLYYASAREAPPRSPQDLRSLQDQKITQLGRLALCVAHDFNNILAVIQGCATMLGSSPQLTPEDRKDVADILLASRRGMEFVRGLFDYSRADRWPECGETDLNAGFDRMGRLLRRLLRDDITLNMTRAEGLPRVRINTSRLDQILLNLVVNARDVMPSGGRIDMASSMSPGFAQLSVSDTGIGMTPDVRARIGEAFFTTKAEGKGTGLGLATVREILEECGGRLEVRSEPGKGTTFVMYIPLAEDAENGFQLRPR